MSDKFSCVADGIIAKFLLNTCRLRPQVSKNVVQAVMLCTDTRSQDPLYDDDADIIPLVTGSVAEFYIEPMLSCVGDIDVMYHYSSELATPAGQSPPTQLPDEFHNYVKVLEMEDGRLPAGYVYLKLRYLLTQCIDGGDYNAVEDVEGWYLSNRITAAPNKTEEIHGPAVLRSRNNVLSDLSFDLVHCMRCLSWPPQAADWPTRHRSYDWPDSATVDRVVSNGCDLVGVAHRQYRDDERVGIGQWRLSFSRAEVVLLNSWMPVQQIVYHLLRKFVKTEQLAESPNDCEPSPVNNYHIKTLMLWACELKPKCWWTEDIRFVKMSAELLHVYADWLTAQQSPHYFVNNCNLIESTLNVKVIASKLSSVDETWLSTWLVDNYIRKCSQLCPGNISRLFDNIRTSMQLQNAVSALVDWRINAAVQDLWIQCVTLEQAASHIQVSLPWYLKAGACTQLLRELATIDTRLSVYFISVVLLRVSLVVSETNVFYDKLMDVLGAVFGQHSKLACYYNNHSFEACLGKTTKLMKDVASKSINTDQLIKIELSKAYLYRALRCIDSYSDSIYCLANIYLAVLYYATGEYQTAIDHCALVTRSPKHTESHSCVVQGELLPKLDEHIDNTLGLTTIYQYVLTASLNQPERKKHVTGFTPELFACCLNISCHRISEGCKFTQTVGLFVNNMLIQEFEWYVRVKQHLFITDALLCKLEYTFLEHNFRRNKTVAKRRQQTRRPAPNPNTELNTSKLVELLQKSAVEHLTTYRQVVSRDFSSVAAVITTDFEALYEYKRGNYQRCLQLSTQNVREFLYAVGMSDVTTYPEFIQLIDDGIVSLTALTLIACPKCRQFPLRDRISQLTLSLYLMTQCQSKLRQSVTSLSQTLDYIQVARGRHPVHMTLDHLTLKLSERMAVRNVANFLGHL